MALDPLDVTVIIPTTSRAWVSMAWEYAVPTAVATGAGDVLVATEPTVAQARNAGLRAAQTEWCVFLDADDALDLTYLTAVQLPSDQTGNGLDDPDVIVTAIRYWRGHPGKGSGSSSILQVWNHDHQCEPECLLMGNWIHVGAIVRTDAALQVGGFDDRWPVYEDWAFWLKLHLAGATFARSPGSVYLARSRAGSRNNSLPLAERNDIHGAILRANGL